MQPNRTRATSWFLPLLVLVVYPIPVLGDGPSEIRLTQFDFLEQAGTPDNPVTTVIPGQPRPGVVQAEAALEGPWATADFELESLTGNTLQSITMLPLEYPAPRGLFRGTFDLSGQPFTVSVTGIDEASLPYETTLGPFYPQMVEVRFDNPAMRLYPGSNALTGTVTSASSSVDSFLLSVSDDLGLTVPLAEIVVVGSGAAHSFATEILVDSSHLVGNMVTAVASIRGLSDPLRFNSAEESFLIEIGVGIFGDGFESGNTQLWSETVGGSSEGGSR